MRAGNTLLPRNTLVTGTGRIQGDRLGIGIVSLEYGGLIIPVELTVYDSDGQEGIYIPNSAEVSAAKEVAANLGQNLGTSISITNQSAGDQLLSELGKGRFKGCRNMSPKTAGGKGTSQIRLYSDVEPKEKTTDYSPFNF